MSFSMFSRPPSWSVLMPINIASQIWRIWTKDISRPHRLSATVQHTPLPTTTSWPPDVANKPARVTGLSIKPKPEGMRRMLPLLSHLRHKYLGKSETLNWKVNINNTNPDKCSYCEKYIIAKFSFVCTFVLWPYALHISIIRRTIVD
jgi:hypothetical protein